MISIDMTGVSIENVENPQRNDCQQQNETQLVVPTFEEFCSNTTVHGFRYLTERGRHWVERLWWIISLLVSVSLCIFVIANVWENWQKRPVSLNLRDAPVPIEMIPFPAITICPNNKVDINKANFFELLQKFEQAPGSLSPEQLNRINAILQICVNKMYYTGNVTKVHFHESETIYKTMKFMMADFRLMHMNSKFLNRDIKFKPIFTADGICYTFNALNSREIYTDEISPELITVEGNPNSSHWTSEKGYDQNVGESDSYPLRLFHSTFDSFYSVLQSPVNRSFCRCMCRSQGFQIAIHRPDELPRLPEDFVRIQVNQELYINIEPGSVHTSNKLRSYSPQQRGCFFESEHSLRFFKLYTRRHCELECIANYVKEHCGCVPFHMPMDKNTKVCSLSGIRCVTNAKIDFSKKLVQRKCNCLPDCNSAWYNVDVSQVQLDAIALGNETNGNEMSAKSIVYVFTKNPYFMGLLRLPTNTMYDFFASCGGLLGLFMGISALSIVELIYYFSLRLFCTLRQRKSIKKSPIIAWVTRSESAHF